MGQAKHIKKRRFKSEYFKPKGLRKTPVVVFVPVVEPIFFIPRPYTREVWQSSVNELAAIPSDVFTSNEDLAVSQAKVSFLSEKQSQQFRRRYKVGFVLGREAGWRVRVVAVSAKVKIPDFSVLRPTTKADAQLFHNEIATGEFGRLIKRWIIASLLAKPGVLSVSDVLHAFEGRLLEREEGPLGLFDENLELASEMKWPPMGNLSIREVWQWLQRVPDFNSDFGISKVGIAIAAFTHLLGRRQETAAGEDLFWALLGLEALYTKGTGDLASQLVLKTQLLLGEQSKFKKAVSQMYHYRSRFVHGDIQIPMRYCVYDATRSYRSYAADIDRHGRIATNVLTSTLQLLASRSCTELSFAWRVLEPANEKEELAR